MSLEPNLFAMDIETECSVEGCAGETCEHALSPRTGAITKIAVTDGLFNEAVFDTPLQLNDWIKENPDAVFTYHNGKFDMNFLSFNGVYLTDKWAHDSSLLAFIFTEKIEEQWLEEYEVQRQVRNKMRTGLKHRRARHHSLKTLAPYFLGVEPFWEPESGHNDREYVLKDARYTLELTKYFLERMPAKAVEFYSNHFLPWAKMLLRMEQFGIRLDVAECRRRWGVAEQQVEQLEGEIKEQWSEHYKAHREMLEDEVHAKYALMRETAQLAGKSTKRYDSLEEKALTKIPELNLNSSPQLLWLLGERLGLKAENWLGEESADKETLTKLAADEPALAKLLDYRRVRKLTTSFFPEYLDMAWNNRIHTTFNMTQARTGRLSSSSPNCLDMQTRVLTESGFKYYGELLDTDKVAVFLPENSTIVFEAPLAKVIKNATDIVTIKNTHFDFCGTPDHRMYYTVRKTNKSRECRASAFPSDVKIIHGGIKEGGTCVSPAEIRLAVAIQADSEGLAESVRLKLYKPRKITRFRRLLRLNKTKYTEKVISKHNAKEHHIRVGVEFRFKRSEMPSATRALLQVDLNRFSKEIIACSYSNIKTFVKELCYWDGLYTRKRNAIEYCSKHEDNADIVLACLSLVGLRGLKRRREDFYGGHFRVYGTYQDYSLSTNAVKKTKKDSITKVWCLQVSSSFFIAERNGTTYVTGNCQQIPGHLHDLFVADEGCVLVTRDLGAIEPTVLAYYSEDETLCSLMLNGGDFHGTTAKAAFELDCDSREVKKLFPELRQVAKTIGLAVLYGAGANQVLQVLEKNKIEGATLNRASGIVNKIRKTYAGVWQFKQQLDRELEAGAVIYNLLGRPYAIPMKQDVYMKGLNTLIQGSASDYLLAAARKAKEEAAAELLLVVHDEAVFQVEEARQAEACTIIDNVMRKLIELKTQWGTIPIRTEGKEGRVWAK